MPPVFLVELEIPGLDLAEQTCLVLVHEGWVPAEENIDDDSDAPHVHRLGKIAQSFARIVEKGRGRRGRECGTTRSYIKQGKTRTSRETPGD